EPIPGGHELLQRKDKIFPGASVDVSEFGCVTALGPEGPTPCPGWGILTPFPLLVGSETNKRDVFAFSADVPAWGKDFPIPFGPKMTPVQLLFTWNPSPASVLKVFT
ncbi:hypothetical protein JTE90_001715, partial [Oedothorax gibbosus]